MPSSIQHRIEQAQAVIATKQAHYEQERASIKKELRKAKALKQPEQRKDKVQWLNMKLGGLETAANEVLTAKDNLIALLDEDLRGAYEKTRGLLSYGIAMGAASPDAKLLFDSLGDYLGARSDSDRKAASKAVRLCFEHGNFGKSDDSSPDDEILSRFEAISDPEEASAFYNKNKQAILAGYEARKRNS